MTGWQALFMVFNGLIMYGVGLSTGRTRCLTEQRERDKMRRSAANYQEKNR